MYTCPILIRNRSPLSVGLPAQNPSPNFFARSWLTRVRIATSSAISFALASWSFKCIAIAQSLERYDILTRGVDTKGAIYPFERADYTRFQNGQLSCIAVIGLSRTARAFAYRLSARGPCAHFLDGISARARGRRRAGDAHGGSGPRPQPRQSTPKRRSKICAGWEFAGRRAPTRAGRSLPTCRASAAPSTSPRGASCCAAARLFPCRCSRKDLETALGRAA